MPYTLGGTRSLRRQRPPALTCRAQITPDRKAARSALVLCPDDTIVLPPLYDPAFRTRASSEIITHPIWTLLANRSTSWTVELGKAANVTSSMVALLSAKH